MQPDVSAMEVDDNTKDCLSEGNELMDGSDSSVAFQGAGEFYLLNPIKESTSEACIEADEDELQSDDEMEIRTINANIGYNGEPPSFDNIRKLQEAIRIQAAAILIAELSEKRVNDDTLEDGNTNSDIETSEGMNNSFKFVDISNVPEEKKKGKPKHSSYDSKKLPLKDYDPIAWLILEPDLCKCPVCNKVIRSAQYIRRHVLTHSILRDIRCDCSPKARYARIDSFRRHVDVHPNCAPRLKQAELENSYFFAILGEMARRLKVPAGEDNFNTEIIRNFYKYAIQFRQACQNVIKPSDPEDLKSFKEDRKFVDDALKEYRIVVNSNVKARSDMLKNIRMD